MSVVVGLDLGTTGALALAVDEAGFPFDFGLARLDRLGEVCREFLRGPRHLQKRRRNRA